jgi:hypothetical protein
VLLSVADAVALGLNVGVGVRLKLGVALADAVEVGTGVLLAAVVAVGVEVAGVVEVGVLVGVSTRLPPPESSSQPDASTPSKQVAAANLEMERALMHQSSTDRFADGTERPLRTGKQPVRYDRLWRVTSSGDCRALAALL